MTGGKTLFLSAGVHGDEVNGVAILQRFMQELDVRALRGTIVFLPLVNVSGFEAGLRDVQYDGKDLNRCFPGDQERGEDVVGILEFSSCPAKGCKPSREDVETIIHEISDNVRIRRSEVFEAALSLKI